MQLSDWCILHRSKKVTKILKWHTCIPTFTYIHYLHEFIVGNYICCYKYKTDILNFKRGVYILISINHRRSMEQFTSPYLQKLGTSELFRAADNIKKIVTSNDQELLLETLSKIELPKQTLLATTCSYRARRQKTSPIYLCMQDGAIIQLSMFDVDGGIIIDNSFSLFIFRGSGPFNDQVHQK